MISRRMLIWGIILIVSSALIAFAPEEDLVIEPIQKVSRSNATSAAPKPFFTPPLLQPNSTPSLSAPSGPDLAFSAEQKKSALTHVPTPEKTPGTCPEPCIPKHHWPFRSQLKVTPTDAFRPLSYAPPPPPPVIAPKVVLPPPLPPPKPVAPPLPFKYLGKLGNNHAVQKDEEMYELVVGQTVADQYKVESINEEQAVFTYLPLQEQQVLLLRNE